MPGVPVSDEHELALAMGDELLGHTSFRTWSDAWSWRVRTLNFRKKDRLLRLVVVTCIFSGQYRGDRRHFFEDKHGRKRWFQIRYLFAAFQAVQREPTSSLVARLLQREVLPWSRDALGNGRRGNLTNVQRVKFYLHLQDDFIFMLMWVSIRRVWNLIYSKNCRTDLISLIMINGRGVWGGTSFVLNRYLSLTFFIIVYFL